MEINFCIYEEKEKMKDKIVTIKIYGVSKYHCPIIFFYLTAM